jgi:hypothetical protein
MKRIISYKYIFRDPQGNERGTSSEAYIPPKHQLQGVAAEEIDPLDAYRMSIKEKRENSCRLATYRVTPYKRIDGVRNLRDNQSTVIIRWNWAL